MDIPFNYYECQLYEDMKEVQEKCIQLQADMWDLEYKVIKRERN